MTRTRPLTLILFAVLGGGAAWLLETARISAGDPVIVPPVTLALALAVIGGLVIALALPIRRAVKARERNRVDPFYATRVVVLAKASSIAGSLLTGAAAGTAAFLLSRSVIAAVGSIQVTLLTLVGAIVLTVGGLIGEQMCSIPPDDDTDQEDIVSPPAL